MKKFLLIFLLFASVCLNAQGVAIGPANGSPDSSAILDLQTSSKGFLPPRVSTAQMNAIHLPVSGLMVYNTDCNALEIYNGGGWVSYGNIGAINTPGAITGNANPCPGAAGITYSVVAISGATAYNWTVPAGATITSGQGTNSITANFGSNAGNICVSAGNACGISSTSCQNISFSAAPVSPTASTNSVSQTQIIWNWNSVAGATGYKYNTINDYSSATDNASGTSFTQSGLTCNTGYTLYVWAYNACGNSTAATLTQTTASCCTYVPGSQTFSYSGSNTNFTVPACISSVTITAYGAGGGAGCCSAASNPGKGALMIGTLTVNPGDVLGVLVGQQGTFRSGGGGGSFIWNTSNSNTLLIAAAGGGGGGDTNNGSTSPDGGDGQVSTTPSSGANGQGTGTAQGGSGGNGGNGGANNPSWSGSGGGAGWFSNGQDGQNGGEQNGGGGFSPLNGGAGGSSGTGANPNGTGGFGGGGGATYGGGGGGGYNGGGGGNAWSPGGNNYSGAGGGGGSYFINGTPANGSASGANSGNGSITITW